MNSRRMWPRRSGTRSEAILDYLRAAEQCVCDIAVAVGSERSNVSRHLSVRWRRVFGLGKTGAQGDL
jgi:DNA-binding transcriptional ArsR family regulator